MQENFVTKSGITVANTLFVVNTAGNTISINGPTNTSNTISVGNSSTNTVLTSTTVTLSNPTSNISIHTPTVAQITNGNYYLNANGNYSLVISVPAGSNTQVAYNNSGVWGGSPGFTFNNSSNTLAVSNTITAPSISGSSVTGNMTATGYLSNGLSGQNISVITPSGALLTYPAISFYGTFGTGTDYQPRRTADIYTYFSGLWGTETLVFAVGNSGNPNDNANTTIGRVYINQSGLSISGNIWSSMYNFNGAPSSYLSASNYTGTSNNSTYFNGQPSSYYQSASGLSANVATLTSNNSTYFNGQPSSYYQSASGLSANVATLTSNNSAYFAGLPLSFFAPITSPSFIGDVTATANAYIYNTLSATSIVNSGGIISNLGQFGQAEYRSTVGSNSYSVIHRNDASNYYILLSNNNMISSGWNSLRPFAVNLATGAVSIDNSPTPAGTTFGGLITANSATITNGIGANTVTANSATINNALTAGSITATSASITNITGSLNGTASNATNLGGHPVSYFANTTGNITGSAYNITQYTINQNLGIFNSPSFPSLYLTNGITFPSSATIYTDPSGNGPGDIVIQTFDGTNTHYSIFYTNGNVAIGGNLQLNNSISDNSGTARITFNASSTTVYKSLGTGWGHCFADSSGTTQWLMGGSTTDINFYSKGDVVAAWSDERLKENIVSVDPYEGLSRVLNYRVVDFSWNEKGRSINSKEEGKRERGLIAQEAQEVNPEIVTNNETALDENGKPYLTIKENKIVFDLITAVQELHAQVVDLKYRISLIERDK
jgi:hypothetical protein